MIKKLLTASLIALGTTFTSTPVHALGSLVTYPFTSDTNASFQDPVIQSTSFTASLSNSFIGDDGFGNVLQAYPTSGSTSSGLALSNNSYFTIDLVASGGQTFDIGSLNYEVGKGGSSDPRGYFIRSSVDSFTTDIFGETLPSGANANPVNTSINLAGFSLFQNLSSVAFRFYVFTPNPIGNSVDFRNLDIQAPTPVPFEFSPALGIGILGSLVVLKKLTKKKV